MDCCYQTRRRRDSSRWSPRSLVLSPLSGIEPDQESLYEGDRFAEVLTLGAARAGAGCEGVVAVFDPGDTNGVRELIPGDFLAPSEDVARSLEDQRGSPQ